MAIKIERIIEKIDIMQMPGNHDILLEDDVRPHIFLP